LVSIVFVTFTLYRAPLTLIFALQGRILPYLVGLAHDANRAQLGRIARGVVVGGTGLALVGAVVGWFVGPEVVGLLYGAQYSPSDVVAMLAAGGVMAAAAAQIASQVLVAEGRTTRLSWAWLGGLAIGLVTLLVVPGGTRHPGGHRLRRRRDRRPGAHGRAGDPALGVSLLTPSKRSLS
jgi:O-antigen/teichoic acid export membrane protein